MRTLAAPLAPDAAQGHARASRRTRRLACVALASVALTLAALTPAAAQDTSAFDAKNALNKIDDTVEIPTRKLKNGLDVIVIEDHSLPLVTIEIAVKNGAYTEPPAYNGLSHLYEHMFFKGNKAIPSQEAYMARQRELGMIWNGTTGDERVNYFFTLGSGMVDEGVEFMANAIRTPLFKEDELVKERKVVIGELERALSGPSFHLYKGVQNKMFWKHPTRKDTIGDRKTILTAGVDKMRTVQERYYIPNNSALILAGDITLDQGVALAEKYLGSWKAGPDPFKANPVPAHPPIRKSEAVIVNKPTQGVTVMIGLHGPSVSKDPEATYAADVASFVLAQQSSAFQKALVETGLALGVSVGYYTLNHTGPISIYMQTTPDNLEKAVTALRAEIAKFKKPDYYPLDQIQTAKNLLSVSHLYDREKTSSYAHTVSFWWAVAGLDYYANYIKNLKAVRTAQILRYTTKYIINKPLIMGILISEQDQKKIGLTQAKANSWAKPIR